MRLRSFAKINLHLQVLGRGSDGYHELVTIFQSVAAFDELEVSPAPTGVELQLMEGAAPVGAQNLAVRAAEFYRERFSISEGVRIRMWKRLPIGAGLGGGSSNAATMLWALQRFHGRAEGRELLEVARRLGADVPYFLIGGTALGEGRGDRIRPLGDLAACAVWLITPEIQVSTKEAFQKLGKLTSRPLPSTIQQLVAGVADADLRSLEGFNDLEPSIFERYPRIGEAAAALRRAGADPVRMSGSGGTVFAVFERQPEVEWLRTRLPQGNHLTPTRTLSRAEFEAGRIINEGTEEDGDYRGQGLSNP